MTKTKIEWSEEVWNFVTGCTRVSDGCTHCYIDRTPPFRMTDRAFDGPHIGATTGVLIQPGRLDKPLYWRSPRRVFVNSLSDVFHAEVPEAVIAHAFAVMALTGRHTYQILTKRPPRMRHLMGSRHFREAVAEHATALIGDRPWRRWQLDLAGQRLAGDSGHGALWTVTATPPDGNLWEPPWPPPNIHLGVSVEHQHAANLRIPVLEATAAAVRFLSCEP